MGAAHLAGRGVAGYVEEPVVVLAGLGPAVAVAACADPAVSRVALGRFQGPRAQRAAPADTVRQVEVVARGELRLAWVGTRVLRLVRSFSARVFHLKKYDFFP